MCYGKLAAEPSTESSRNRDDSVAIWTSVLLSGCHLEVCLYEPLLYKKVRQKINKKARKDVETQLGLIFSKVSEIRSRGEKKLPDYR